MSKDEIMCIEVGDYIYVEEAIYRSVFHDVRTMYKPNRFYLVTGKRNREIKGFPNHSGLKVGTDSEFGPTNIFLIRNKKVSPVVKHLHLVKKDIYSEIKEIDFFGELK